MKEIIGIYGGTFNPPHLGHQAAAAAAIRALGLTKLILIPACDPPHKDLPPDSAAPEQRLAMTEYLADNLLMPKTVSVSDIELKRTGKSYTVDTVRALHKQYPDAKLWLLMGTDMFLSFHRWYLPEDIAKYAGLCAFARAHGDDRAALEQQAEHLKKKLHAKCELIEVPDLVEISSTELRARLALCAGERAEEEVPGLAENVYGYILRQGLYGTHADMKALTLPQLRAVSYSMMRAKRIAHVKGVEQEAVRLAKRWGADAEKAGLAAILHDCTKYFTLDEQLKICSEYGIVLDTLEQRAVKLLHSKTGACMAKYRFGQCDDVFRAIFWHTTGHANMTLLEKVIYMADYIEPNRDFPGVEKVRALAYEDLDAAMVLGLQMTVEEMAGYHEPVHPNTLQALNDLKTGGR